MFKHILIIGLKLGVKLGPFKKNLLFISFQNQIQSLREKWVKCKILLNFLIRSVQIIDFVLKNESAHECMYDSLFWYSISKGKSDSNFMWALFRVSPGMRRRRNPGFLWTPTHTRWLWFAAVGLTIQNPFRSFRIENTAGIAFDFWYSSFVRIMYNVGNRASHASHRYCHINRDN